MMRRPLSSALSASAGKPVKAIKAATSVETGLLQIQCAASSAPDPALQKLPGETCEVIEIFQSGRDSSGRELTRCFLRLADLDSGIFNGLAVMRRRSGARSGKRFSRCNTCSAPGGRYRQTVDRWQR